LFKLIKKKRVNAANPFSFVKRKGVSSPKEKSLAFTEKLACECGGGEWNQ